MKKNDSTRWGAEYGEKPVIIIRFNPHNNKLTELNLEERIPQLIDIINKYLTIDLKSIDKLRCNLVYMYYSQNGNDKHIKASNCNILEIIN